jgi:hypothetical protein
MKPVPAKVLASGPKGTIWHGGPVDKVKMSLRVAAPKSDWPEVSKLLGCQSDARDTLKVWCIEAPESLDGNVDSQIASLLARLTSDLSNWQLVSSRWKVDIFCGLFLERPNRGLELGAQSMRLLSERGITVGLDIYSYEGPRA